MKVRNNAILDSPSYLNNFNQGDTAISYTYILFSLYFFSFFFVFLIALRYRSPLFRMRVKINSENAPYLFTFHIVLYFAILYL